MQVGLAAVHLALGPSVFRLIGFQHIPLLGISPPSATYTSFCSRVGEWRKSCRCRLLPSQMPLPPFAASSSSSLHLWPSITGCREAREGQVTGSHPYLRQGTFPQAPPDLVPQGDKRCWIPSLEHCWIPF